MSPPGCCNPTQAIAKYPEFLRGMCLANPTLPEAEAVKELERLCFSGFVGARFNPGLFPGQGHAGAGYRSRLRLYGTACWQAGKQASKHRVGWHTTVRKEGQGLVCRVVNRGGLRRGELACLICGAICCAGPSDGGGGGG